MDSNEKPSQVAQCVESLESRIAQMDKGLSILEGKLHLVLRPKSPMPASKESDVSAKAATSPLVGFLDGHQQRLDQLNEFVSEMISRIEV